ncbi:uncharacterized protein LOC136069029 [Quercus suber]|uniref:uncharacterized protein LOC136069029 n=1 Tax=Quercus suber TaxID=58331 RepID=UPI0032E04A5B
MSMREGETLKAYSDRYWEMFNEVDGAHDDVAMNTFKEGLPTEHGLRKSLTGKPVTSVRQLMDRIDKYRRVEEDQMQGRGKSKAVTQEGGISGRTGTTTTDLGGTLGGSRGLPTPRWLARVPRTVQRVLEKIKNEPFFRWPKRWRGILRSVIGIFTASTIRPGHITEDCNNLWDHLES